MSIETAVPETTLSLREQAGGLIGEEVAQAEKYSHQRHYHKLHVHRDGTVDWFYSFNRSDDLIDREARGFAAIPSVITVGVGGTSCNCDYCNNIYDPTVEAEAIEEGRPYDRDEKFNSQEDALRAAVSDSDLSGLEHAMLKKLAEIPVGYFDDEEEEED